jgi:two-component system, chemotaxis family, CheB/CheR fusion protein
MSQPSLRILVVDDRAEAVELAALLLSFFGHQVETAFGGEEALAAAQKFEPDVILLDIGMPGLDGWEVARRLRQMQWLRRPVLVAVTAYGGDEDRDRSCHAGFDHHLVKPADLGTITKILTDRARALSRDSA